MAGRHEWACFAAQQAAEKAVKALHLHLGQEAWGHVIAKLLRELPEAVQVAVASDRESPSAGQFLYPGRATPTVTLKGAPFEHYGPLQSEAALAYAREILDFARAQMA